MQTNNKQLNNEDKAQDTPLTSAEAAELRHLLKQQRKISAEPSSETSTVCDDAAVAGVRPASRTAPVPNLSFSPAPREAEGGLPDGGGGTGVLWDDADKPVKEVPNTKDRVVDPKVAHLGPPPDDVAVGAVLEGQAPKESGSSWASFPGSMLMGIFTGGSTSTQVFNNTPQHVVLGIRDVSPGSAASPTGSRLGSPQALEVTVKAMYDDKAQ